MSGKATGDAFDNSPLPGGDGFVVHLAIADAVGELHDWRFWMKRDTLAKKARCSVSTVARTVAALIEAGWLEVISPGGGRGKPTEYRYHVGGKQCLPGMVSAETVSQTVSDFADTVSNEPTHPLTNGRTVSNAPAAREGRRDLLFEALCDECGWDWRNLTKSERGKVNAATKQLREIGVEPGEVASRAGAYRLKYPGAACTPMALAGNWSSLKPVTPVRLAGIPAEYDPRQDPTLRRRR